jgi:N6-adenosine-specific RNA methylase IME4
MHELGRNDAAARRMGGYSRIDGGLNPQPHAKRLVIGRSLHSAEEMVTLPSQTFGAILADPPWRFQNATGKVAPEHRRLHRYATMTVAEIEKLPVAAISSNPSHLYLWCPNAMLKEGLRVMDAWCFQYKTMLVWHKIRKDGGSDGRGVGFYFRNVTEVLLFGTYGRHARTLAPGRRQVNYIASRKREHSRKPDEVYGIIEACSPGPFIELFGRGPARPGWLSWGDEADA